MIKNQILNAFPCCEDNKCLHSISKIKFEVRDSDFIKKSEIVDTDGTLVIQNSNGKELNFLAIDGCLILDVNKRKSDCAVFDDKDFYFVELKKSKTKKRSSHRINAIEQLKQTIQIFKEANILFFKYNLYAVICFNFQKNHPISRTGNQANKKEFWDKFKTVLMEGNEISFK